MRRRRVVDPSPPLNDEMLSNVGPLIDKFTSRYDEMERDLDQAIGLLLKVVKADQDDRMSNGELGQSGVNVVVLSSVIPWIEEMKAGRNGPWITLTEALEAEAEWMRMKKSKELDVSDSEA